MQQLDLANPVQPPRPPPQYSRNARPDRNSARFSRGGSRTGNEYSSHEHLELAERGMTNEERFAEGRRMQQEAKEEMRLGEPRDVENWKTSIEGVKAGDFIWIKHKEVLQNKSLVKKRNPAWFIIDDEEMLCKTRLAVVNAVLESKLLLRVLSTFSDGGIEKKRQMTVTDSVSGEKHPFLRDYMHVVEVSARESVVFEENCFEKGVQMYWRSDLVPAPAKTSSYMPVDGDTYKLLDTTPSSRRPLLQVAGSLVDLNQLHGLNIYDKERNEQRYGAQKHKAKQANARVENHRVAGPPLNTHGSSHDLAAAVANTDSFAGLIHDSNRQGPASTSQLEMTRNVATTALPITRFDRMGVNTAVESQDPVDLF
jgi:hypothetical protein